MRPVPPPRDAFRLHAHRHDRLRVIRVDLDGVEVNTG